jgi:hypothetical protein
MTKRNRTSICILVAAITLASVSAFAQTDAEKAFSAIKALPGTWEGNTSMGPVKVTFKVTAGGSAVMSEILGHEDMITMFNLDGPRLVMTHYCAAGNEPRMQASVSPNGKVITFNFVDAMNLASPEAAHMHRLVLTLVDDSHHTEEWTFTDHGKEHKEMFDLHRKS